MRAILSLAFLIMSSGLRGIALDFYETVVNTNDRMRDKQVSSCQKAPFTLLSERLGPLPLVNHFIQRIGLEETLDKHVPSDTRCAVPQARTLGVLLRSIIV